MPSIGSRKFSAGSDTDCAMQYSYRIGFPADAAAAKQKIGRISWSDPGAPLRGGPSTVPDR